MPTVDRDESSYAKRVVLEKRDSPKQKWQSVDGRAALLMGDCLDVLDTIPENSIDCIWTDPPYLLSNGGTTCFSGRMVAVEKGDWDRSNGIDADHLFNLEWIRRCHRVLAPGGTIWISGTIHVYLSVGMALLQSGFRILNDIIWEKPAPPPNLGCRCFTHSTETILWATKVARGARHVFNYRDMKTLNCGRQMKNVWRIGTPADWEKTLGKHPTQKPVALVERCLLAATHEGQVVLDPFTGSGTTGVAALRLRRGFLGIERDERFFELAKRRVQAESEAPVQPLLAGIAGR